MSDKVKETIPNAAPFQ